MRNILRYQIKLDNPSADTMSSVAARRIEATVLDLQPIIEQGMASGAPSDFHDGMDAPLGADPADRAAHTWIRLLLASAGKGLDVEAFLLGAVSTLTPWTGKDPARLTEKISRLREARPQARVTAAFLYGAATGRRAVAKTRHLL